MMTLDRGMENMNVEHARVLLILWIEETKGQNKRRRSSSDFVMDSSPPSLLLSERLARFFFCVCSLSLFLVSRLARLVWVDHYIVCSMEPSTMYRV